jgi:uncharacterized protein (TIGR00255 family)
MTGYGKTESQFRNRTLVCEVRSLNSKALDLSVRIAPTLRAKELDIRTLISKRVERGKVDLALYLQDSQTEEVSFTPINWEAVRFYSAQYKEHIGQYDSNEQIPAEIMAAILRMPDVIKVQEDSSELTDEEWTAIQQQIESTLDAFVAFRTQEGQALQQMFNTKLDEVIDLLAQVEQIEKGRVDKIRERLEQNLNLLAEKTKQQIDANRLEQEMIYYLEKLDITEEKVRLTNHVRYFRETMDAEGTGVGKKLGFIAQEMGREINTLGSKSNQSEMQIIVVKMKDILEQIKEQVLNVL